MRNLTTTQAYPKIPTYSWTFAPIPNWTWTCSSLLSFDAKISNLWLTLCTDPTTWLTLASWMIVVGCKVLHFINNEVQETLGYKTLWCSNTVAFHRKKLSSYSLYSYMMALKISFIYVLGYKRRNPKQIHQHRPKFRSGIYDFVKLNRLSCCWACPINLDKCLCQVICWASVK